MLHNGKNLYSHYRVLFEQHTCEAVGGFSFRYKEKKIPRHKPEEIVLPARASRQLYSSFASFVSLVISRSSEKTESIVHETNSKK